MEEIEMAYINELIGDLRIEYKLTLEDVARITDFSTSAINRYETSEREVPALFLKRFAGHLFAQARDLRLICWVTRGLPIGFIDLQNVKRQAPPGEPAAAIAAAIAAIEDTAKSARFVERIVCDGIVDESDDTAIDGMLKHTQHAQQSLAALTSSILAWREQTSKPQGGNRQP